mmetsp:Transcript_9113/g.28260  ORF Transcript_9113/g.28260 Transcript_9113/m.28260 type:complete len:421 (+) Transcript_9113:337-1599(+)
MRRRDAAIQRHEPLPPGRRAARPVLDHPAVRGVGNRGTHRALRLRRLRQGAAHEQDLPAERAVVRRGAHRAALARRRRVAADPAALLRRVPLPRRRRARHPGHRDAGARAEPEPHVQPGRELLLQPLVAGAGRGDEGQGQGLRPERPAHVHQRRVVDARRGVRAPGVGHLQHGGRRALPQGGARCRAQHRLAHRPLRPRERDAALHGRDGLRRLLLLAHRLRAARVHDPDEGARVRLAQLAQPRRQDLDVHLHHARQLLLRLHGQHVPVAVLQLRLRVERLCDAARRALRRAVAGDAGDARGDARQGPEPREGPAPQGGLQGAVRRRQERHRDPAQRGRDRGAVRRDDQELRGELPQRRGAHAVGLRLRARGRRHGLRPHGRRHPVPGGALRRTGRARLLLDRRPLRQGDARQGLRVAAE